MKDLCNGCRGLGCVDCGLQGTVEVEDPSPPVHVGLDLSGVPTIGAPMPSPAMIRLSQMYPPGKCRLVLRDVEIFDELGSPVPPGLLMHNQQAVFLLVIRQGNIQHSIGGSSMKYDVDLEPC